MALEKGGYYLHPDDGVIYVTGGSLFSNGRISNHFTWRTLDGSTGHGYGMDAWPKLTVISHSAVLELPSGERVTFDG